MKPSARSSWTVKPWLCGIVGAVLVVACLGAGCPSNNDPQTGPPPAGPGDGARDVYASPNGLSTNDGTRAQPVDLATALSSRSPVGPGRTVWLLGGTYRAGVTSQLVGRADAPIVVRPAPGERVVLDGANPEAIGRGVVLTVLGAHTWFWGFEVTFSSDTRTDTGRPSEPNGIFVNESTGVRFINLIVHDVPGQGLGVWAESVGVEVYGAIIYHNGTNHFDHGIYTQNSTDTKRLEDNVIFGQASHGIHAFGSSSVSLDHFQISGNVSFNNGLLVGAPERNILVGGGRVARDLTLTQNFTYYPLASGGSNNIGYEAGCADATVTDNYFAGRNALTLIRCSPGEMSRNVLVGGWDPADLPAQYPANTYQPSLTSGVHVAVRPNRYERGRAHVIVYNWALQSQVAVDLSASGLRSGEQYEIRDIQNLFGTPVATGTFTGAEVVLPMTGLRTALPTWRNAVLPRHTAPEFAVFLVQPR